MLAFAVIFLQIWSYAFSEVDLAWVLEPTRGITYFGRKVLSEQCVLNLVTVLSGQ